MNITPEMMVEDEKRWYARDVIKELSYCGNYMRDRKDMTNLDIRFYAYLMRKAHDMLKAQEPRVLTEEELKRIEPDSVYWGEGYFVRNLWPMAFTAEAIQDLDSGYLRDSYGRDYELDLYNKNGMGWRIWTARPGDEVRKETKWDEE